MAEQHDDPPQRNHAPGQWSWQHMLRQVAIAGLVKGVWVLLVWLMHHFDLF